MMFEEEEESDEDEDFEDDEDAEEQCAFKTRRSIAFPLDYFCVCCFVPHLGNFYFYVLSGLCIGDVYYPTLNSGYPFLFWAQLCNIYFLFFS